MIFYSDYCAFDNKKWSVHLSEEGIKYFPPLPTGGSFRYIAARLLGLEYPDYCKMLENNFEAVLIKRQGYILPVFYDKVKCQKLCNELNIRWNKIFK